MTEPVTLQLTKPIAAFGQDVMALTLKPLTAKDLRQCGMPFTLTEDGRRFDTVAITKMIVACAQIPTSSVEQMTPEDYNAALGVLMQFFTGSTPEPPSS